MTAYYNEFDPDAAAWLRELIADNLIAPGDVDERSIIDVQPDDIKGYDQHHWFAGIGGWSYALRLADWPDDKPVWTASLPCQPFSTAGKQLGKQDERHLLPHFLELVKQCRPETIFGEQVASSEVVGTELEASFIVSIQQGDFAKANKLAKRLVAQKGFTFTSRWIDDLYAEMEINGYSVRHSVLGAHSIGAAHIRQRLYWVADSGTQRYKQQSHQQSSRIFSEAIQPTGQREQSGDLRAILDCGFGVSDSTGSQPWRETSEAARYGSSVESTSSIDWLYCRDNKYRPIESGLKPLVDVPARGMVHSSDPRNTQEARKMRLKGYGNAIVPTLAAEFIRAVNNT